MYCVLCVLWVRVVLCTVCKVCVSARQWRRRCWWRCLTWLVLLCCCGCVQELSQPFGVEATNCCPYRRQLCHGTSPDSLALHCTIVTHSCSPFLSHALSTAICTPLDSLPPRGTRTCGAHAHAGHMQMRGTRTCVAHAHARHTHMWGTRTCAACRF